LGGVRYIEPIDIPITKRINEQAKQIEKLIQNHVKNYKPNYTGFEAPHRYYKGALGELCFARHLDNLGLEYDFKPRTDGMPDSGDFVIYLNSTDYKLDIKTGGGEHLNQMYLSEKQIERYGNNHYLYIGARINKKKLAVELWGWAFLSDFSPNPRDSRNRIIKYSDLRSLSRLTDKMPKRKL